MCVFAVRACVRACVCVCVCDCVCVLETNVREKRAKKKKLKKKREMDCYIAYRLLFLFILQISTLPTTMLTYA